MGGLTQEKHDALDYPPRFVYPRQNLTTKHNMTQPFSHKVRLFLKKCKRRERSVNAFTLGPRLNAFKRKKWQP